MFRFYQGKSEGFGLKVGIVVSKFNEPVTYTLLAETEQELLARGVDAADLTIAFVPGALEVPQTILKMMRNHELHALIGLGAVIKGETAHFEHVARESARGITSITTMLETPVINGILTTYDVDQAVARVTGPENKGIEAARAALEMANLFRQL